MKRRNAEQKQRQLEDFLMNVAESAENALREYWQERDGENRRYAAEYVTRRGRYPQRKSASPLYIVPQRRTVTAKTAPLFLSFIRA